VCTRKILKIYVWYVFFTNLELANATKHTPTFRPIRTFKTMHNKRHIIILLISLFLLLIPLIAMQFSDEVNWTTTDFIIAGSLLFGAGLISEIVIRKIKNINYKMGLLGAILIIIILIWIELAVGIFGTPFSGN